MKEVILHLESILRNVRYNCNTEVNFIGYNLTLGFHFKECKAANFKECDLTF